MSHPGIALVAMPQLWYDGSHNSMPTPLKPSFPYSNISQAGLLENNVYNDKTLFYSNNLETAVNQSEFTVPWLYREEVAITPQPDQYYFLETNGISSKADLYLNGVQIASKKTLKGAYGGLKFDITKYVKKGKNAILIRAYPTNYLADFALGFVDWNPYPPDNGTGVWREVTLSQTGPVSLLKPRVVTDYTGEATDKVAATIKVVVQNNSPKNVQGTLEGVVREKDGKLSVPFSTTYNLKAGEVKTLSMTASIDQPNIWWPKLWGAQPLYTLDLAAYTGSDHKVSDRAAQRTFGIRHVTSAVNSYNDTAFTVNGNSFQVLGAGYSSDMFLRLDESKLASQFALMLDMGLNTVRLEGKQEQPILYDLADSMGLMVLAGWECCDKWEGWSYNDEADGVKWVDDDYDTASKQMNHEAYMMQGHPSMLGFLVGSDFWPDDRAAKIYVDKLRELDWDVPIIASAAKRGYPEILGPSGMKMGWF
jgi:exo-1,4-beta-D-glucosaminidase